MKENKKPYNAGNVEEGMIRISLINQGVFIRRKKVCPLKNIPIEEINYKNLDLLDKFLTERGKIISSRVTHVSTQKQRALMEAVKMARHLALISPTAKKNV